MNSEQQNRSHDTRLKAAFLGWQCRIREYAIRKARGRPSAGMRPNLIIAEQTTLGAITTVLNKREPADVITEFQYIVKKTHDPRLRFEAALTKLQVSYYQKPTTFSDCLTASFSPSSSVAQALLDTSDCRLVYFQSSQRYEMNVMIKQLDVDHEDFLATFWHNAMFNPHLSLEHKVLQFIPDWSTATADPTPFS